MPADEFRDFASQMMQTPTFAQATEQEQQMLLGQIRDEYKKVDPNSNIDDVAQQLNIEYRRATGQGRYIPSTIPKGPWDQVGWDELNEDEKVEKIDQFRQNIPSMTVEDPLNAVDTGLFLKDVANLQQRKAQGENTGRVEDLGYRFFEGIGQIASSVLQNQELSDAITQWSESKPEYDDDFISNVASGLGSTVPTIAVGAIVGAATGGVGLVAGGATLSLNAASFYGDAYLEAVRNGADEQTAHRAGIYSLPGAAIDAMGDMFIASKFLPGPLQQTLQSGSEAAKREAISEILSNTSLRGSVVNISKSAFAEGVTEAAGDLTAGYGAYLATGDDFSIPTGSNLIQSFLVGGTIGAGFGGVSRATTERTLRNRAIETQGQLDQNNQLVSEPSVELEAVSEEEVSNKVVELVQEGKFKEAEDLSKNSTISSVRDPLPWNQVIYSADEQVSDAERMRIDSLGQQLDQLYASRTEENAGSIDNYIDIVIDQMFNPSAAEGEQSQDWSPTGAQFSTRSEAQQAIEGMDDGFDYRFNRIDPADNSRFYFELERRPLRSFPVTGETIARARDVDFAINQQAQQAYDAAIARVENNQATNVTADIINQSFGLPPAESSEVLLDIGPFDNVWEAINASKKTGDPNTYIRNENGGYFLYNPVFPQQGVEPEEGTSAQNSAEAILQQSPVDPFDLIPGDEEFGLEVEERFNSKFYRNPRRRGERGFVLLPSGQDFSQAIKDGAQLFRSGVQRFSDWSAEMVAKYGDLTRDIIDYIWESIRDTMVSVLEQAGIFRREPVNPRANRVKELIRNGATPRQALQVRNTLPQNQPLMREAERDRDALSRELARLSRIREFENPQSWTSVDISTPQPYAFGLDQSRDFKQEFGQGDKNVRDMLQFVSEKSPEAKALADGLLSSMNEFSLSARVRPSIIEDGGKNFYRLSAHEIGLDFGAPYLSWRIMLHEATHAGTSAWVKDQIVSSGFYDRIADSNPEQAEQIFNDMLESPQVDDNFKTLISLFMDASNNIHRSIEHTYRYSDRDQSRMYGLMNLEEFIAEAFTQPTFQIALEKTPSGRGSMWSRFKTLISSVFGFNGKPYRTLLDDVLDISSTIMKSNSLPRFLVTSAPNPKIINYSDVQAEQETSNPDSITVRMFSDDPDVALPAIQRREAQIERLNKLKRLKIADRIDRNTRQLSSLLRRIKPREVELLSPTQQDDFYSLVDHLFQARATSVKTPDIRQDFQESFHELNQHVQLLDTAFIIQQIKQYGDTMDMSSFQDRLDNNQFIDRAEFEAWMNKTLESLGQAPVKGNKRNQEVWASKQEAWREKYAEAVEQLTTEFPDADSWISHLYELNGREAPVNEFTNFLRQHHEYMTRYFNPALVEGADLYRHFHAINNMLDGRLMYVNQTSIPWMAEQRESSIDFESLNDQFRDPVMMSNNLIQGIDNIQKTMELKQTQLGRFSAFQSAKDWLQNDLMGGLFDSILRTSQNQQDASKRAYVALRQDFESKVGREMNREDHISMSIFSRIIQWESGKNPNLELMKNIKNEWKAIYNITGDPETNQTGRGTNAQRREKQQFDIPILEKLTEGLEDSPNPMQDLMDSLNYRLGLGETEVGGHRADLLNGMQELMDQYSFEMEMISEGFYNKPFKRFMNYLPRRAVAINSEMYNSRENSLTDEIGEFNDNEFRSNSMTATPEQLKDRNAIGDKSIYSNNLEYIFDRGVRIATLTVATTPERYILKQQLKAGTKTANLIGGQGTYRVNSLEQWAVSLFQNAMQTGSPLGPIGRYMKVLRSAFANVSLSGVHQLVTQTVSSYGDYHARTNNIVGAMQASEYYIKHKDTMDAWFERYASRITNRSTLGEEELDKRRNPNPTEAMFKDHPAFKVFEKYYDGAANILTWSLRTGDDFSAKSLVMAEYVRQLKKKGYKIQDINDVQWDDVEGNILTQSMLEVEKVINSSDKITRGELFTDRTMGLAVVRDLTMAFASHQMTLASQFALAARDLNDLYTQKAGKDEIVAQLRVMGGIMGSSFLFSSSRFWINSLLATGMIGLLRDLFDDDEGKIADLELKLQYARDNGDDEKVAQVQSELNQAKAVRKAIQAFDNRQRGGASYFQQTMKDELGSIHFVFAGPEIPQRIIFPVIDNFGEQMYKEAQANQTDQLRAQIKKAQDAKNYRNAAKLKEKLFLIESQEYLPWHIESFDSAGVGGVTGSALEATYANLKEFTDASFGLKEINLNDYILAASSFGIGQADLNRFLKQVDKIEDEQMKKKIESEETVKKAKLRQQEQDERAADRRLRALINQIENN